jgi:gliding motility-associated-like protein
MRFFKLLVLSTFLLAARQVVAQCPSIVGATNTVTDISCFGFSDGSIRVKLNTGDTPTNFELYDVNLGQLVVSNTGGVVKTIDPDFMGVTFTSIYSSTFAVIIYKTACAPVGYAPFGGLTVLEPAILSTSPVITPDCNPATGPGNQAGSITLNTAGGNTPYQFAWSDGPVTQNRPNIDAGTYSVIVTDKNGCTITTSNLVVPGSPTITLGANPQVCIGTTSSSINYSATTDFPDQYRIDWASGITDVPLTPLPSSPIPITGIPLVAGTYTGTLFVSFSTTGCESIGYPISVTVNPLPIADAGADVSICIGSSTNLAASGGVSYAWLPATGLSATNIVNPVANPAVTTTYTVTVTDANGCVATDDVTVTVNPLPIADAGADVSICIGSSTNLAASGGVSYAWSPATGLSATNIANPVANPAVTTTYTVTVTDANGCVATDDVIVTINPLPLANAGPDAPICIGGSTNLAASGGVSYLWSPATGLSATNIANPVANPAVTTTYTVTVTDANGCVATDDVTVTVNPLPIADAGADVSICIGSSTNLAASGGVSYAWSPATGLSATNIVNPVANPAVTTTYTVTVTDANGCVATDDVTVTVNPLPIADAGADVSICIGSSTNLAASGGVSYLWSPATGLSATNIANPVANPAVTTTYTVTVTDANGCVATDDVIVTINPLPLANAGPDAPICIGGSTNLAASGGVSYLWSPATGLSATNIANPVANPAVTTTYTVTVTDANGCVATDDVTVTVNPLPIADAGADVSICIGSSTNLAASGGVSYAWSPATGLSATNIVNPVANPAVTTTYTVTVTDANGCVATDDVTVTVNPLPIADAGADVSICIGSSTNLAASGGVSYAWSPATGLSATNIANPVANPAVTTTYTVTVTDANGCVATDDVIVTINPLPLANAGPDAPICIGGSTNLAASGGVSYAWSPATGLSATNIANPVANPAVTTTYTVTVTDANGCVATDDVTVTVNPLPIADAGADVSICIGSSTNLAASGGVSYAWSPATGLSAINIVNPVANPAVTTTYTVTVTDANGCVATDDVTVTVNPLPIADAGADVSICPGSSTNLNASGGVSYTWSPSTGLSANTISNPIATPAITTTYTVTVTDANGCINFDQVMVSILVAPTASINGDASICIGDNTSLQFEFTGTGPWTYEYTDGTSNFTDNSTTSTISQVVSPTVNTTYTLLNVSDATCAGTIIGSPVQIAVSTFPDASLTLGLSPDPVCVGGSATITIFNSESGVSYQLRNDSDNSLIGTAIASTGGSLDLSTGPLNATSSFNVLAVRGTCSIELINTVTANVQGNVDPTLTITAQDTQLCEGSSTDILIDNTEAGVTYQLRNDNDDSLVGSAVAGTGGQISLPTGVLTSSMEYNVLASNGTCSVEMNTKVSVSVDINPDPSLATTAANNPLCVGGSTTVSIVGSEVGVSYQLRDDSDNSSIGSAVAGTGGTIALPTGVLNSTITFNVLATGGVCVPVQLTNKVTITVSGTINLSLVPTPELSPICEGTGTNIQIANSENGVNYQLIVDAGNIVLPTVAAGTGGLINLPTGLLNSTTAFRVAVSSLSCSAELSSIATVNITPLPSDLLAVVANSSNLCVSTSTMVQVENSEPGVSYQLRNDADDSSVSGAVIGNGSTIELPSGIITTSTTFNVLASNSSCSQELSTKVTINILDAPDATLSVVAQDPTVCLGLSTQIQVLNTEPGIIYQLRDNADNSIVSGAVFGNGGTISLPTGPFTAARTFNVTATNSLCLVQLTATVTVTLKDANDPTCSNCSTVVINTVNATKVTCNALVPDGSIEFDIQPPIPIINNVGVIIEIAGPTPKSQTDNFVFSGLAAGSYTYTVTYGDVNNPDCIKTGSFEIEVERLPDPINFDLVVDEFDCLRNEGSITLSNFEGATATDFQYVVINESGVFAQGTISFTSASFKIGDLNIDDYEIQLIQNQQSANGCVGEVSSQLVSFIIAEPIGGCGVIIPNVFTPNGDGSNDVFEIRNLPSNSSVTITNRWGKEVYRSSDYQNDWSADSISDGIYYYRIVVDGEPITGWVEILR